jgi:hypothetical protein
MTAARRFEIASKVQFGLALAAARQQASSSTSANIRHREAARDRQGQMPSGPGHHRHSRALPASLVDDARADSDDHPRHRRDDAWRGRRTKQYPRPFVADRGRPCSSSHIETFMGPQLVTTEEVSTFSRNSQGFAGSNLMSGLPPRGIRQREARPSPLRAAQRRG